MRPSCLHLLNAGIQVWLMLFEEWNSRLCERRASDSTHWAAPPAWPPARPPSLPPVVCRQCLWLKPRLPWNFWSHFPSTRKCELPHPATNDNEHHRKRTWKQSCKISPRRPVRSRCAAKRPRPRILGKPSSAAGICLAFSLCWWHRFLAQWFCWTPGHG